MNESVRRGNRTVSTDACLVRHPRRVSVGREINIGVAFCFFLCCNGFERIAGALVNG
jgi:hypothetical protein